MTRGHDARKRITELKIEAAVATADDKLSDAADDAEEMADAHTTVFVAREAGRCRRPRR